MKNRIHTYIYIALAAFAVSCEKLPTQQDAGGDYISFYVSDKNFSDEGTKAIVEDTQTLFSLKPDLRVCDLAGINSGETDIVDQTVKFNQGYNLWRSSLTWKDSRSYEFYGYILSAGTGSGASVALVSSYQGNKGHCIDLKQPTAYTHNDAAWSDYLLSYRVTAEGKNKPLVRMEMERITSGVELFVSTPEGSKVVVESMEFTNISRSLRYTIAEHAIANSSLSGIRHKWVYQNVSNDAAVTYKRAEADNKDWFTVAQKADEDSRFDSKFRMMRFLTVPQDVTGTLTIVYRVDEKNESNRTKWTQYTASFNLAETAITRWELGRKTRYYINLDTAVDLEGVIADWVDIDYVEGTFLPR